jgi:hypothetical protein
LLVIALMRLVGFSPILSSIRTGDNTSEEFVYSQNVRSDVSAIDRSAEGLHPACDKGGQLQRCYAADLVMISTLRDVLGRLEQASVPSRYTLPHKHLVDALELDSRGFTLRNQAIARHNNADWQRANAEIQHAADTSNAALDEFPKGTVLDNG